MSSDIQNESLRQKQIEAAENAERQKALVAIREGLDDVEAGRTSPAKQVLRALAHKYGIDPA